LLSAFPKAMRDPFPLARISGIIALANTDRFYTLRDVATKVLPSLCAACVDPEKDVRDEAFKTIKFFMQKLEKVSDNPEQALEMEKDVTSCALELKNETSWTSWAMTGLSAKMTGYKNKNQQPSVALNTQPLGPPPSLVIPSTGTSSEKPSPNKTQSSVSPLSKTQQNQEPSSSSNKSNDSAKTQTQSKIEETNIGWNLEDDQWKDLDDDGEQMEPLEVNNAMSYLNQSSKNNESKSSSTNNNNDWSGWTNSFEDEKNTQFNDLNKPSPSKNKPTSNAQSQLPLASSYNWSVDSTKNEEDMFSSLVKDIKINNNSDNKKSNNASDWSSGWGDEFEDSSQQKSGPAKRQERQQRNAEKQTENENKMKQSKPLKLGQKKDPIF
jgi:SCY1-like protein 1